MQVGFSALPYESHHQRAFEYNLLFLAGLLENSRAFAFQGFKQFLDLIEIGVLEGFAVAARQVKGYRCREKSKSGANAG